MAALLIVDDEEGIRAFLADALATDGYEVMQAANGIEALAQVHSRSFDLMITDLKMPGALDGIDVLRRAKSEQPDMEVIVLTAHGTVESAVEAMKLGAYDYLQKPIASPAELRLVVARALERRRLVAKDALHREIRRTPPLSYGDPVMLPVITALEKVARTASTVLLLGESGTGKELAANAIHELSPRRDGPFVPVNCAAISETLMESEIFGHEKGAFTGASTARRGRLELADGGTLFLDEIGELKPELQAKLLRVLQERRFERVGGTRTIEVDVRWISATNRDLQSMIAAATFREDLYHRLAVFPIRLPPLRERRKDLLPLAEALIGRISAELRRPWRGNVRELANTLERAAILADGDVIRGDDLQVAITVPNGDTAGRTMEDIEREAIRQALAEVDGNRRRAAERLGIGERTLYEKLKRFGMT